MKDIYYFPHDINARNDPKLQRVQMKLGHEGKSVYWDLIEIMHAEGGKLKLKDISQYADILRTKRRTILCLVDIIFEKDSVYFWSNRVLENIAFRNEKSSKARFSAKSKWAKYYANAERPQMRTQSERYAIKENKIISRGTLNASAPQTHQIRKASEIKSLPAELIPTNARTASHLIDDGYYFKVSDLEKIEPQWVNLIMGKLKERGQLYE